MNESLCWHCKNAYGSCSWAKHFKPINGWQAEPTIIKNNSKGYICKTPSYIVYKCPNFTPDLISKKPDYKIAKDLGVSPSTYLRHKRAGTLDKLIANCNKKKTN